MEIEQRGEKDRTGRGRDVPLCGSLGLLDFMSGSGWMQARGVPPSLLHLSCTQSLSPHFSAFATKLSALRFGCAARRSLTCSLHCQHPACQPARRLMRGFWEAARWCYWLGLEGRACLRRGSWGAAGPVAFIGCLCITEKGKKKKMFPQELAQKIKGYQEQIASLNSKCKMLTMKAKHATMLLTVTEVEGLSEGMEELDSDLLPAHPAHPSVVMVRNALVSVPVIWAGCFCIIATLLCSKLPQLTSTFCFWNGWSVASQTSCSFPLLYFALYGFSRLADKGWSYLTDKYW